MTKELVEKDRVLKPKPEQAEGPSADLGQGADGVLGLQQRIGNRAVQRLLAQRSADGGFELDDETAGRISEARGGGQTLDTTVQKQMGAAMGHDFSGVRVHTGSEAADLNRDLSAKSFTTGQDIFFQQGAYDPGSSSGQELLAHELTHVVQQSTGAVSGGQKMTVNPPGDVFEQEADTVAKQVTQRQVPEEEKEKEGGVAQTQALQRVEQEDQEEKILLSPLQRAAAPEDELQEKALQRAAAPEEEELEG